MSLVFRVVSVISVDRVSAQKQARSTNHTKSHDRRKLTLVSHAPWRSLDPGDSRLWNQRVLNCLLSTDPDSLCGPARSLRFSRRIVKRDAVSRFDLPP